jgi:hypothetical protein
MCNSSIEVAAAVFTAIGTVAVAILAIWGPSIKTRIAGPRLEISLRDSRGDLNVRADKKATIYYHLSVRNLRAWSPAEAVRVLVVSVAKRRADGSYFPEPIVAPLQLMWAFPGSHEQFPTIAAIPETCDFGYLEEGSGLFRLSTYIVPNNFRGHIARGDAMQVRVIVAAHNSRSVKPLLIEISWDGEWSTDLDEMQRHLVIKEITAS